MQQVTLSFWQAALIALWVALVMSRGTGYSSLMLRFSPLMTGLIVGVVMGNVPLAMTITATIQLIYMGVFAPGGAMASEPAIATAIAVPAAILSGLAPAQAIGIAVPVGLLGGYLYSLRFFINTFTVTPLMDRYARELNDRGLTRSIIILPIIVSFLLFFPAMFITLYKGVPLIGAFVKAISAGKAIHVLGVVGGGLVSLGIALTIKVIGKKSFLPFFLLAYFLFVALVPLKMNIVTFAVIGAIIAYLFVLVTSEKEEVMGTENRTKDIDNTTETNASGKKQLTNKDLHTAWFRWWYANEIPHTFDRMIAPSLLWALTPSLRKLYKNKKDLQEAYERHTVFFNTQAIWGGGTVLGVSLSLEEVRAEALAEGKEENVVTSELINSTKVGLMGPLAAIGDSIDSGTVEYILIGLFLPWAVAGSAWGALLPWITFVVATYAYGFYFVKEGYGLGRNAATEIIGGKTTRNVIKGLSVLGLFMMGVLAASYVKVSSPLVWTLSGKPFALQTILDSILPGILPLAAVMGVYFYFEKRGLRVIQALLGLTVILIVLGVLGIL